VHYVGTLEDGTEFDSSRVDDRPFTVELGKNRVIKAWDVRAELSPPRALPLLSTPDDWGQGFVVREVPGLKGRPARARRLSPKLT